MTTTILDLIGALLLVLAFGLFAAAELGVPAGLAAGGGSLLVLSWLIDRLKDPRKGGKQ